MISNMKRNLKQSDEENKSLNFTILKQKSMEMIHPSSDYSIRFIQNMILKYDIFNCRRTKLRQILYVNKLITLFLNEYQKQ